MGTCQRCGNYLCTICWTRWLNRSLCTACLERALEAREAAPEETRAHLRQAILAVVFGVAAWGITLVAMVLATLGLEVENIILVSLSGFLLLGSPLPAALGIGQGAAAIRARGDHMIMATIGLLLSAFQVGVILGLFLFGIWQN